VDAAQLRRLVAIERDVQRPAAGVSGRHVLLDRGL
jgi:hypothetical protein